MALYGDAEQLIRDLTAVNRRLVAAVRALALPIPETELSWKHLDEAITVIERIEARLGNGRGPDAMATNVAVDAAECP